MIRRFEINALWQEDHLNSIPLEKLSRSHTIKNSEWEKQCEWLAEFIAAFEEFIFQTVWRIRTNYVIGKRRRLRQEVSAHAMKRIMDIGSEYLETAIIQGFDQIAFTTGAFPDRPFLFQIWQKWIKCGRRRLEVIGCVAFLVRVFWH